MSVAHNDHSDPLLDGLIDLNFGPASVDLSPDQIHRIVSLRDGFRLLARHIASLTPCSYEREQALRELDVAHSFTVKAIARHG